MGQHVSWRFVFCLDSSKDCVDDIKEAAIEESDQKLAGGPAEGSPEA